MVWVDLEQEDAREQEIGGFCEQSVVNFPLTTEIHRTLVLFRNPNERNHRNESRNLTFRISDGVVLHFAPLCQIQTQYYPSKVMDTLSCTYENGKRGNWQAKHSLQNKVLSKWERERERAKESERGLLQCTHDKSLSSIIRWTGWRWKLN